MDFNETTIIENEEERNDAMGDIVDPTNLTLEDFSKEFVWKDNGMERQIWFRKPQTEDHGWGRNRVKGDATETIEVKLIERENDIIQLFGAVFYERCRRMADMGLVGDESLKMWFKTDSGEKVFMRDEAIDLGRDMLNWHTAQLTLQDLCSNNKKLTESALLCHRFFKERKDKRWATLKKLVIEAALEAKSEDAVKKGPDVAINNVKQLLGIRGDLAMFISTFVFRFYWAVIKAKPSNDAEAKLIKWLNTLSIQKTMESNSDYIERFDNRE